MAVISIKSAGWLHGPGRTVWLGGAIRNFMAWVADGAANTFTVDNLTKITRLTRTDWQGTVALSLNPRTNYFIQSENLTYFGVNSGSPTITATTVSDTSASTLASVYKFTSVPMDSNQYAATALIAKNAPNIIGVAWRFSGGTNTNQHICALDTVTGNFKAWDMITNLPVSCNVDDLGANGWAVTLYPKNDSTNNTGKILLYPAWASTLGSNKTVPSVTSLVGAVSCTKIMLVPGTSSGSYIPTTTAPVTVTDYALAGEEVTLGETPVAGAVFTLDGDITADVEGA